jgi:hypothetical protein
MGSIFGLAPLRAAELVTATPRLLTLGSARLTASREQLVAGLGMKRDALSALVSQCPALILEAPATVSHSVWDKLPDKDCWDLEGPGWPGVGIEPPVHC